MPSFPTIRFAAFHAADFGLDGPGLWWLGPNDEYLHHALEPTTETCAIGRSLTQDIALENLSVSRKHVLLRRAGDGWRVVDAGSVNGTFIERPLGEHSVVARIGTPADTGATLRSGDTLVVGSVRLHFEDPNQIATDDGEALPWFPVERITPAEQRTLTALCGPAFSGRGWASNQDIAQLLCVELTTVRSHMRALYRKFDVVTDRRKDRQRAELVRVRPAC